MQAYLHPDHGHMDFLWNVDCSIGKNAQNSLPTDIRYIQWYDTLAGQHPQTPQDRKDVYRRVGITGICDGFDPSDPLVAAITVHQTALSHPMIDGRISVAHGEGKIGESAFFVLRLGARFAKMFPEVWPRLDLIRLCPTDVARAAQLAVPNPGNIQT